MSEGRNPPAVEMLLVHEGLVRGLARAVLRGDDRVEDVVQDTWAASIQGGPDDPQALRGWLARVARRFALMTLRKDAGRRRTEGAASRRSTVPSAAEIVEREEARRRVLDALLALDPPHREALLLRFYEGLAPREIARRLDVPVETARTRVKRGLERLRERLLADRGPKGRAGLLALALPAPRVPLGSGVAGAGGVLVGKKIALAVAALALLLGGGVWFALQRGAGDSGGAPPFPNAPADTRSAAATLPAAAPRTAGSEPAPIAGPRLFGIVVGAGGAPVPAAAVLALPENWAKAVTAREAGQKGGPGVSATTDAVGRFALPARDGTVYDLHVEAEGYASSLLPHVRAGREARVTLSPPDTLVGRVVDVSVAPIAGARLRLYGLLGAVRYERDATSAADGGYRLPLPSAGDRLLNFQVEVRAEGYAVLSVMDALLPWSGRERRHDFVLVRGATLVGRVLDAETGEPLPDARVVVWSAAGTMPLFRRSGAQTSFISSPYPVLVLGDVRTGADGSFTVERLPARGFDDPSWGGMLGNAVAWKEGWSANGLTLAVPEDGARVDPTIRLFPAAIVVGRVVTSDGRPAYPATVTAGGPSVGVHRVAEGFGDMPGPSAATDAEGRYRIPAAPASRRAATSTPLVAREGGFGNPFGLTSPSTPLSVRAGETTTAPDLVIPQTAPDLEAVLRIVGPDGRPVPDARVSSQGPDFGPPADTDGILRIEWSSTYPNRPPIAVVVRATGFAPTALLVTPGKPPSPPVTVSLNAGRRLTGRVTAADGTPVPGALVIVADPAADEARAFPDPIDLANADFANMGSPKGPAAAVPPVVHGWTTSAADGAFAIEDLPVGPYQVCARLVRAVRGVFPVLPPLRVVKKDVPADAEDLVLALPKDDAGALCRAEATITDAATGKSLLSFRARLVRGRANAAAIATGPGRCEWEGVPAGRWTLEVSAPGYADGHLDGVELRAGAPTPALAFALSRGATVFGRALDENGAPLAGYEVAFVAAQGRDPTTHWVVVPVGTDGTYRASGLSPGRYRLQAGKAGAMKFPRAQGMLAPKDGRLLTIEDAAGEKRLDIAFAPAAELDVRVLDDRLPAAPSPGYPDASDEQVRFGDSCHVVVLDERAQVVADQRGLWSTGHGGALDQLILAPGTYSVRVECGSEPVRVERVQIVAGGFARALFQKP